MNAIEPNDLLNFFCLSVRLCSLISETYLRNDYHHGCNKIAMCFEIYYEIHGEREHRQ